MSDPRPRCRAAEPNIPARSPRRTHTPADARRARPPVAWRHPRHQGFRWARAHLLRNSNVDAGQGAGCSSGSPHCRRPARISAALRQHDSINRPRSSSDICRSAASSSSSNSAPAATGKAFEVVRLRTFAGMPSSLPLTVGRVHANQPDRTPIRKIVFAISPRSRNSWRARTAASRSAKINVVQIGGGAQPSGQRSGKPLHHSPCRSPPCRAAISQSRASRSSSAGGG